MRRFLLVISAGMVASALIVTASLVSQKAQAETPAVIAIEDSENNAVPMINCPCSACAKTVQGCHYECLEVKKNVCVKWVRVCVDVCIACEPCDRGRPY